MRTPIELHRLDVPSWSLWLVAGICFGPLILVWLLGVLLGAAWLLLESWRFLLAGAVRPDRERRERTVKRERRDDWRLDA